jgi:arginyl-tRNA synthetase
MFTQLIRTKLDTVLQAWARDHHLETLPAYTLEEPPKNIDADLASNAAMLLAKTLKTNPRQVADELVPLITTGLGGIVDQVTIAGAGFLNFKLSGAFLAEQLTQILVERDNAGRRETPPEESVLIEFVSANPTGPLHIGHGRGAAIGDSLARIFTYLGFEVIREYYLNDVGNQMEMLGRSLEARYRQLSGEDVEFPADGYQGEYMRDIARTLLADKGPHADNINFKQVALDAMMATIGADLKNFAVSFDNWFSESVIAAQRDEQGTTAVDRICAWLKEKGLAYEQEGALWFASTKYGDDKDRVLRRSDGRYTYLASDIAYHKNKLERGFDRLIDLWGADHHGYVPRMKAAVQALGADPQKLTIVLYQLVSLLRGGKPVTMSTRAGEFVTLEEVVTEVGKDACRFFFMLRAPDSPLEFDLELAKKQSSENPVFYVQYVHARCSSIFKESRTRVPQGRAARAEEAPLALLTTPEERALIRKLISFGDTLELCARNYSPHHLTIYLMEVADQFHRFYERCRVLGDDMELTRARLALVSAVAIIIRNGLELLGVAAPEHM